MTGSKKMDWLKWPNVAYGGVAKWLGRSVSNHASPTHVCLNSIVGTTNHKPTVNSAVHPSEVGK